MNKIVKLCKTCGPLTEEQIYKNKKCKACSIRYAKVWPKIGNNKEKRQVSSKEWKKNNPDKVKQYRDNYLKNNHIHKNEKDREYGKKYYQSHIEERRKIIGDKKKIEIIELHNTYVKSKLARKYNMKVKDVPIWMVEIKRPLLKIKRKIKEVKNDDN